MGPLPEARAACWPQTDRRRATQPPAAVSAMDGYAVRAEDVPAAPATFTLVGEAAGRRLLRSRARPGEAVRIFTGGAACRWAPTRS